MDHTIGELRRELAKKYLNRTTCDTQYMTEHSSESAVKKTFHKIHTLSSISGRLGEEPTDINQVETHKKNIQPSSEAPPPNREVIENLKQRILRGSFLEEENLLLKKTLKLMEAQIEKKSESQGDIKEMNIKIESIKENNEKILSSVQDYGQLSSIKDDLESLKDVHSIINKEGLRPRDDGEEIENIKKLLQNIRDLQSSHNCSICLVRCDLTKLRQDIRILTETCKKIIE